MIRYFLPQAVLLCFDTDSSDTQTPKFSNLSRDFNFHYLILIILKWVYAGNNAICIMYTMSHVNLSLIMVKYNTSNVYYMYISKHFLFSFREPRRYVLAQHEYDY